MNPVLIIPTYWRDDDETVLSQSPGAYDHATPLSGKAELDDCLTSLEQVRGLTRVVVLLVAPPKIHDAARARVKQICADRPFETVIIDSAQSAALFEILSHQRIELEGETVSLRGYGAIRNFGLVVAAALGHDVAVFIDDDEIVLSPEFMVEAVYGLGQKNRQGLPIVAKSGYFLDRRNSCYADQRRTRWYNRKWSKREEFNAWMNKAQSGSRISRSNVLTGGCYALHAEAYTRVAFDPWITRGEDQDYLINLRLYGLDVWFDNKWFVRHMPPKEQSSAPRFMQNVYRWVYEYKKLEMANAKIDLQPVTSASLMPYPGPWVGESLKSRIKQTALMRAIGTKEHAAYADIFFSGFKRAQEYAEQNCDKYLKFQAQWPKIMAYLWQNKACARMFLGEVSPRETVQFLTQKTGAISLSDTEQAPNINDQHSINDQHPVMSTDAHHGNSDPNNTDFLQPDEH